MGITRKSLFGFPPAPRQGSQYTQREVPLSQGMQANQAWPVAPPGSAITMSNYWPLDGVLVPRSRLSSLNTIRTIDSALGMSVLFPAATAAAFVWASNTTTHAVLTSNGSMSRASFVSSFGLGVAGITNATKWQYALAYMANINDNALVAASSSNTLMVLYHTAGSFTGLPLYSYLTSAPQAIAVGNFDDYLIAFNTREANTALPTRVRWCVRGLPSNWTSEGSGFEDLLDMRGNGTAVKGTSDGRVILFSDREIWYGVTAAYPAQFTFACLDNSVGCIVAATIADTPDGLMFLGSDNALRLLPRGGGQTQVIFPHILPALRIGYDSPLVPTGFAVYDPIKKIYHLFLEVSSFVRRAIAINTVTGEWGYEDFADTTVRSGVAMRGSSGHPGTAHEGVFFGNSSGTVYSFNSKIGTDSGSTVTSIWQSPPVAADLPGNYKQLTQIDIDYRAASISTLLIQVSQDGGNTFDNTINTVTLPTAPVAGRATAQVYVGGALPTLNVASTSTGYEIHRIDVTMALGGRRSG